jgi:DNA primase
MEIQALKSHLSILDIASKLGIMVNKQGRAHCPFHEDKTPSLQFSKEKNICTCFSSNCTAGTMDSIRLTEKKLGLSTHQAIMQLKAWIEPAAGKPGDTEAENLSRTALLLKAFGYFENSLRTSTRAKSYLESRGLVQAGPGTKGIEVGYHSGAFHQKAYGAPHSSDSKKGIN